MRRRTALAGLAGLAAALAGCRGDGGGNENEDATGNDSGRTGVAPGTGSLTPAPVPSVATPSRTPRAACPELPTHAEVYVCSATVDPDRTGLLLTSTAGPAGRDRPVRFRLTNRSGFRFVTGDGWWTVARRDDAGWRTVAQGAGDTTRAVAPGEAVTWRLRVARDRSAPVTTPAGSARPPDGPDPTRVPPSDRPGATDATDATDSPGATPAEPHRVRLRLSPGRHAFSVTGYVTGGELTALIAPFTVPPEG